MRCQTTTASKPLKNLFLFGLMASASMPGTALAETSNEELLQQMKQMQKQIERLQSELDSVKKTSISASATAKAASSTAKMATRDAVSAKELAAKNPSAGGAKEPNAVKITMDPVPKFETADGSFVFKVGGFAQLDTGFFNDDVADQPNGTNVRRARLNVSGTIAHDFNYKIEDDFANNASTLTDVYLQYNGFKPVSITAGQFKEPFGLDELTSDNFTTFIERASVIAFAPDRNIGIAVSSYGDSGIGSWTATLGGFGSGTGTASADDEARSVTGRLTLAPIADKDQVLHFGVAGSHRIPLAATDAMTFQSKPENSLSTLQAVSTGVINNVDNVNLLGLEASGVYGPASLQGEYDVAKVNRNGMTDATLNGWYVEASYFLTGESRNYDKKGAKYDRVRPKHAFSLKDGGWGGWQVGARYGNLDLNDGLITGGRMKDMTFSLKWLLNDYVMLTGNYIRINNDINAVTPNDDPDVFLFRAQFDF